MKIPKQIFMEILKMILFALFDAKRVVAELNAKDDQSIIKYPTTKIDEKLL
ncbi:hypothetical protein [Bacillus wiedmannii]|uniref:hypothetical protein n=1 Tax=Bacillus wiedmannii TaxID=1890302 RepID=UPI0015CF30F4|nr:hypothetical protein [Bacillus wiedmannii]MDP1460108.1 hypothetical protein [Bacillus wiedmannii]